MALPFIGGRRSATDLGCPSVWVAESSSLIWRWLAGVQALASRKNSAGNGVCPNWSVNGFSFLCAQRSKTRLQAGFDRMHLVQQLSVFWCKKRTQIIEKESQSATLVLGLCQTHRKSVATRRKYQKESHTFYGAPETGHFVQLENSPVRKASFGLGETPRTLRGKRRSTHTIQNERRAFVSPVHKNGRALFRASLMFCEMTTSSVDF